jgi:hypothetical protein
MRLLGEVISSPSLRSCRSRRIQDSFAMPFFSELVFPAGLLAVPKE